MSIEERVLKLSMDDGDFQRSADSAISKMDQLKESLEFGDVSNSAKIAAAAFSGVADDINGVVDVAATGAHAISSAFSSAWDLIYEGFMTKIGFGLADKITALVQSCTIAPVADGWAKYEESTNAVQKTIINTGWAIEDVQERLDILATYSDQTSYSYNDMTNAMSSFVSAGNGLDESVSAIIGLSNWAATAGLNASTASGAYDMFAKAVSAGYMSLQQWSSLQRTYKLGTTGFYEVLQETAKAAGMLKENADGTFYIFNKESNKWDDEKYTNMASALQDTLKYKWLTTDLMFDVLEKYGGATEDIMTSISAGDVTTVSEAIEQLGIDTESFGYNAMRAAQEAKTWTDVVGAWKDAVSTQYRGVFENLFGNYEEAAVFWTDICDTLGGFFWDLPSALSEITKEWHGMDFLINGEALKAGYTNYQAFVDSIMLICNALLDIKYAMEEVFTSTFGTLSAETLGNITTKFGEFAYLFREVWASTDNIEHFKQILIDILKPINTGIQLMQSFYKSFVGVIFGVEQWEDGWGKIHDEFTWVTAIKPIVETLVGWIDELALGIALINDEFVDDTNSKGISAFDQLVYIFEDLLRIIKAVGEVIGGGILHFLGIDTDIEAGNNFSLVIELIVRAFTKLFDIIVKLETPLDKLNGFLETKASKLGLTKTMKDLNGATTDVSEVIEEAGTAYEDVKDLFDKDSWNLIQAIYGGDTPEEAWQNALAQWDAATKDDPLNVDKDFGDRLFNGQTFGEWLENNIDRSDVSAFDLLIQKIKTAVGELPTINEILDEVWTGFNNANNEYGFNLPTSWEDFLDKIQAFVTKAQSIYNEYIKPFVSELFGTTADDTEGSKSIFETVGELAAVIMGSMEGWKDDRWTDVELMLNSLGDIISIVSKVVTDIIGIFSDGEFGDDDTALIVGLIRSVSGFISNVIQAGAVLIDSIGVALGATDGSKIDEYSEGLGSFGTIIIDIGTIIGNIIPHLITMLTTIWTFLEGSLTTVSEASSSGTFDKILGFVNQVIAWLGELVLNLLTWVNGFLAGGHSETELSKASGVIGSVMSFLSTIFAPLGEFFTGIDFSGILAGDPDASEGLSSGAATLGDALCMALQTVVDIGGRMAGILVGGVADIAKEAITDGFGILITFFRQLKILSTVISGLGLMTLLPKIGVLWAEIRTIFTLRSLLAFPATMAFGQKMKVVASWLNDFANVLLTFAKALLVTVVAIAALGYLFTKYPEQAKTGTIVLIQLALVLLAFFAALIFIFEVITDTSSWFDELGPWAGQVAEFFSYSKWYAVIGVLLGFAAVLGILVVGVIALTAVIALFKDNGLKAADEAYGIILGLMGMVMLIAAIMLGLATLNNKFKIFEGVGSGLAVIAALLILTGFLLLMVVGITAVLTVVTLVIVALDKFTGGQAMTYFGKAAEVLLLAVGAIAVLLIAVASVANILQGSGMMAGWGTIAKIAVMALIVGYLCLVIEILMASVVGLMSAMVAANDLQWGTILKAVGIIVIILALVAAIITAVVLISEKTSIFDVIAKASVSIARPLLVAAAIVLASILIFKSLVNAMVTLGTMDWGDVDIPALWNILGVLVILMAIAILAVGLIMKFTNRMTDYQVSRVGTQAKTVYAMIALLLGFFTLFTWVLAKFGTKNIDTKALWSMIGVIFVLGLIVAGITLAAKYFDKPTALDTLWTMFLALGALFAALIVAVLVLKDAKDIKTKPLWSLLGVLVILAFIVAGMTFVAKFFKTGVSMLQLVVMFAALVVCFGLLVLAAKTLSKIRNVDKDAVDTVMNMAEILMVLAGVLVLIPMLVSLIPGIGMVAAALGAVMAIGVGLLVVSLAVAIYILIAAVDKLSKIKADNIVEVFDAIGEGLNHLFGSEGAIIGVATGIAAAFGIIQPCIAGLMGYAISFVEAVIVLAALIAWAISQSGTSVEAVFNLISQVISAIATNLPIWFDQILVAMGECMISLIDFINEYTPLITQALTEGLTTGLGGIGKLLADGTWDLIERYKNEVYTAEIEKDPTNLDNYVKLGEMAAQEVYGTELKTRSTQEYIDFMQSYAAKMYEENTGSRITGWKSDHKAFNIVTEANLEDNGYTGDFRWADYYADYIKDYPDQLKYMRSLTELLTEEEQAYFIKNYSELASMAGLTTDDLPKGEDYWKNYYGEVQTDVKTGAEETADAFVEAGDTVAAGENALFEALGIDTNGIVDKVKSGIGSLNLDSLGLGQLSSLFGNLDTSGYFGNWGAAFSSFGEGTTAEGVLSIFTQLNLVDSNGKVLSGEGTDLFNQLLGNSGALTSNGTAITSVQGLVDVFTSGNTLYFNGQEVSIGDGDLGSLLSGLITESAAEAEPAVVSNDVVIEGNTVFNTTDVMGDATTLQTDGVALYQVTGQMLGAALLTGFYSNYTAFSTKATTMVQQAIIAFRSKYMSAYYAGQYIATGAINGMNSKKQEVYDAGKTLGQQSILGYKKGGGIESPSKYTYEAGRFIGEGAINGMMSMASAVYDASYSLGDESVAGFSDATTVTPVIDTTAFQNGVGRINDTFAEASALNADYTISVNGRAKSTKDMLAEAFAGFDNRLNSISSKMGFGEELNKLGDRIGEMGFYVDGKKFARAMADHNDTALARNYIKRGRS